ncbi:MAG: AzlC family ABC transporter permease [Eubacteriales bacterium]|nr:AzlC family ABC transporter permease [Eubacteriales bacterium]
MRFPSLKHTPEQKTDSPRSTVFPRSNSAWFRHGLRDGIPIGLGYFAVSFTLGIAAREIGMSAVQAFLMSLGLHASAGEFAAIMLIAAGAGVIELITTSLVINLRYFLMSCALSQKLSPKTPFYHRFLLPLCMTDEIFGLSVSVNGFLNPCYTYGIMIVAALGWESGTFLGALIGNILPAAISNAMSVSLYGMFLAIIIPPARRDRFIALLVAVSMAASLLCTVAPVVRDISSGFRVILLTLVIAGAAAFLRPVQEDAAAAA